jgi:hypothetical protein
MESKHKSSESMNTDTVLTEARMHYSILRKTSSL